MKRAIFFKKTEQGEENQPPPPQKKVVYSPSRALCNRQGNLFQPIYGNKEISVVAAKFISQWHYFLEASRALSASKKVGTPASRRSPL